MRYIYRSSAGLEAEQGQKSCDPVQLCDPSELFRDPPPSCKPVGPYPLHR
jgi:hypothetical protein